MKRFQKTNYHEKDYRASHGEKKIIKVGMLDKSLKEGYKGIQWNFDPEKSWKMRFLVFFFLTRCSEKLGYGQVEKIS